MVFVKGVQFLTLAEAKKLPFLEDAKVHESLKEDDPVVIVKNIHGDFINPITMYGFSQNA